MPILYAIYFTLRGNLYDSIVLLVYYADITVTDNPFVPLLEIFRALIK